MDRELVDESTSETFTVILSLDLLSLGTRMEKVSVLELLELPSLPSLNPTVSRLSPGCSGIPNLILSPLSGIEITRVPPELEVPFVELEDPADDIGIYNVVLSSPLGLGKTIVVSSLTTCLPDSGWAMSPEHYFCSDNFFPTYQEESTCGSIFEDS